MIYLLNTALAKKSILKTYLEIVFAELILRSKKNIFCLVNLQQAEHSLKVFKGSAQPHELGSLAKSKTSRSLVRRKRMGVKKTKQPNLLFLSKQRNFRNPIHKQKNQKRASRFKDQNQHFTLTLPITYIISYCSM